MMYLTALFVSPLYFLLKKKWGALIVHSILYPIALFLLFFFGIGFFLWLALAVHALWDLRHQRDKEMAQAMATEMVAAMERRPTPPAA